MITNQTNIKPTPTQHKCNLQNKSHFCAMIRKFPFLKLLQTAFASKPLRLV